MPGMVPTSAATLFLPVLGTTSAPVRPSPVLSSIAAAAGVRVTIKAAASVAVERLCR